MGVKSLFEQCVDYCVENYANIKSKLSKVPLDSREKINSIIFNNNQSLHESHDNKYFVDTIHEDTVEEENYCDIREIPLLTERDQTDEKFIFKNYFLRYADDYGYEVVCVMEAVDIQTRSVEITLTNFVDMQYFSDILDEINSSPYAEEKILQHNVIKKTFSDNEVKFMKNPYVY
ncbi:hypothetical protein QKU48_gp0455 [Fadolivirus algeromassiliense]|jgi:hypothetical protein|uniref:Uncharacterized protein n=1 Tax=Fadolivirus FV1/VV64 TaxID=3070911 RepID=A0A7D3UQM0_9VIRU|nr:hypothetical protein QKU48_gp0455 [Fadolivirus algeromassiliense]QKF93913.1 hypothetical protein Fadolivirus_1_455 [Fadolivirus FV1/VV64]